MMRQTRTQKETLNRDRQRSKRLRVSLRFPAPDAHTNVGMEILCCCSLSWGLLQNASVRMLAEGRLDLGVGVGV